MKPETQKIAVFVLFLAVLSVLIYYLVSMGRDKTKKDTSDLASHGETGSTGTGATTNINTALFPLKKGQMNSKYVKALQKGLNQKFSTKLDEDGDFGNNTQKAVETHLDKLVLAQNPKSDLPSKIGVWWALFQKMGFDKLV